MEVSGDDLEGVGLERIGPEEAAAKRGVASIAKPHSRNAFEVFETLPCRYYIFYWKIIN